MPRPSRRLLLVAALALAPLRSAAAQDLSTATDLGQLLALEDRREFDAAVLQRAAQHPDPVVRSRAAMSMGRIGDRAATAVLLPMLTDRDSTVRVEVVFALGELGDRAAAAELAAIAGRFEPVATGDFVVEVIAALAKLGGPEAERVFGAILDRHPPSTETADRATATVLAESFRLGRRSPLMRRLPEYVRSAGGDWRLNAVYSAGRLRIPEAASAILEVVRNEAPEVRAYAARSLVAQLADSAGIPREAFVAALRQLMTDTDPQVRINAIRAIGTFADSALAPAVAGRLVDRDPNVPMMAAQTLGQLRGAAAAATLAERLPGANSFGLRRQLLLSLAQAAPARALDAARAWRGDADWRTRAAYAEMLGIAATPAAQQQLTEMCADPEPRVVAAALNALGSFVAAGDSALLALARARLSSPDVQVRSNAIELLGRSRQAVYIRDLTGAYRTAEADGDNDARLAAIRALADIADSVPSARAEIESALLAGFPRSRDYLVRRTAAARFGEAAVRRAWGALYPLETGRSAEEYRELARRYILGQGRPGPVTIETDRGNLVLQLYSYDAPLTVENFLRLVDRRYFDNGRWHRVVPNFVIQDGDPRGDGSGGPGTVIRDEINRRRYDRGTLGMALSGPDTGGSQFFITHSPQPHLDGGYTVFGHVTTGWNVLDQIVQGDRLRRITR